MKIQRPSRSLRAAGGRLWGQEGIPLNSTAQRKLHK